MGNEGVGTGDVGSQGVEDISENGPTEGFGKLCDGGGEGDGLALTTGVDITDDDTAVLMTAEAFEGDGIEDP